MKALVFRSGLEVGVEQVPDPVAGPGEVALAVEAAGICHTDLDILHGRYPAELPRIPGHEFAGTIVAVGDGVPRSRMGERVAIDPLLPCGSCRNCLRGHPNLCATLRAYGAHLDGGLAEFAVVRAGNAHPIGDLDAHLAALAEPVGCAVNAIERAAPGIDDRAVVIGAGPMGMLLGIVLEGSGVHDLTAVDVALPRLERAGSFGFRHTIDSSAGLVESAGARGFDLVIDATGRPAVVQDAIGLLADAGTLVPFGVCPPGSKIVIDPNEVYARQLRIIGSFSLASTIPRAVEILRASSLPLGELVTHRYPLDRAAEALAAVGTPESLKIHVSPTIPSS
ncbi:alcohol dehydrogenase catalytic domain-containing protein [Herbiconiux solani]|uniref:alcohol dehydrogenase catalytic domain-containing protein n=1 Tax=Herbiconiux solani TaxID=661329 RepID=UPI000826C407|nr:alcohol dehydrogenase catalytic domain-containing protein [Herbiconiux solani]